MSEDFVRKDIHELETRRLDGRIDDAVMRIEARLEASLAEMKAQNAAFREHVTNELVDMKGDINQMKGDMSQMKGEMSAMKFELKSEISAVRSEVSNISKNVALIMTIFGLVISAVSIAIQVWK